MYDHMLHHGQKNIFVIVYKLLVKKKYYTLLLKAALKLMAKNYNT